MASLTCANSVAGAVFKNESRRLVVHLSRNALKQPQRARSTPLHTHRLQATRRAYDVRARYAGAQQQAPTDVTQDPTVAEVMNSEPILLQADMPIKEAVQLMLEKDISGAPVVDGEGRLMGVLSEADVIWKGVGTPQDHFLIPPVVLGFADITLFLRDNKKIDDEIHRILAKTVREAMTSEHLCTTSPGDPMSAAAQMMLSKEVNLLPVVEGGKVVGILTRHDILRGVYARSPYL